METASAEPTTVGAAPASMTSSTPCRSARDRPEANYGDHDQSNDRFTQHFLSSFITSTVVAVEEQSIVTHDMSTNMQRGSAKLAA
jgi:hypothetical protein